MFELVTRCCLCCPTSVCSAGKGCVLLWGVSHFLCLLVVCVFSRSVLMLLLMMFARRQKREKHEPLLQDHDIRDDVFYYDEEGGGEDDQVGRSKVLAVLKSQEKRNMKGLRLELTAPH